MKYNKILIALLFIGLAACSGDDFLSLPSETDLVTETFFQSQGDFEKAVNGAYGPLLYLYRGNTDPADGATFWAMAEMHSDNSHYIHNPNYRATTDWEQISNFIYDPTSDIATQVYRTNYQIIARSNEILDKIDAVDFDADVKDNLKGQAHFLRAMAYFNLVQYYGEVPMHLEPVSSFEGVALPLSPVNDIYAQIVLDAVEAATLLPLKSEQEAGRATSGAAQTLLGNVYLVQEDFVAAERVLRNVVNSGEYQLMTNYADVFDPNNKNNIESVFEVQYKEGTEGYASNFTYTFVPQPITAAELTALMEQYITAPTGITALTQEAYNVPTPDIIQAYEAGDLRLDATIGYGDAGGTTYPFVRKYLHEHSAAQLTNNSWPVYRYSEVLLLLAEALIEQGKESDALPFINEVRQRAGLADITATANLADALLQERRIELAFENKRWLDLVRLEKAVDVISDFGARVKANPQDYYYPAGIGPVPAAFTDIQLTFPLPAAEAQLSPYF